MLSMAWPRRSSWSKANLAGGSEYPAVRSGQEPGALLGYQFERGLHERYTHIPLELDAYIYDFRDEFPLAIPVDENLALG